MKEINPLLYITNWTPIPETILNASNWFETEYMTVRIDETEGTSIGWFLAQGWIVTGSTTETRSRVVGSSSESSSSSSVSKNYVPYSGERYENSGLLMIGGSGSASGSAAAASETTRTFFVHVYNMKRRKLQSERVLQDMITQFTKAYNEGRLLNDRRYDEIVTIYNVMSTATQEDMLSTAADDLKYDTIIDGIITALPTDFATYESRVEGLLTGYGESHRDRINTQFDNQLSKARADLISRGMYNGTVWTSVASGTEEARAKALTDVEDKISDRTLASVDKLQSDRMEVGNRIEAAAARLGEMKRKRVFDAATLRNAVITAMLAFMERREDEYPGIGELANIASGLGYAEGGSVKG